MVSELRSLRGIGCLLVWLVPVSLPAADAVAYELQSGSSIMDDCDFCDRAPILRPLVGTFTATLSQSTDTPTYELTDISLSSPGDDYSATGTGTFIAVLPDGQDMTLDLAVNGVSGIKFESTELQALTAPLPFIDITVTEPAPHRDPSHVYTIRIRAAPKADMVPYELVTKDLSASTFLDDCPICAKVSIPVPIAGTFLLGKVSEDLWFTWYRVDAVDFTDTMDGGLKVTGSGWYKQGGDFVAAQEMRLELLVHEPSYEQAGSVLTTEGEVLVDAAFPDLDVPLKQENPASLAHVFSLHIVAAPGGPSPVQFRRGDANGDGSVDLADAVKVLFWLFLGDSLDCLDAADADHLDDIRITDAVYILKYLFLKGTPPPAPGPIACGPPADPSLGCASYRCN